MALLITGDLKSTILNIHVTKVENDTYRLTTILKVRLLQTKGWHMFTWFKAEKIEQSFYGITLVRLWNLHLILSFSSDL